MLFLLLILVFGVTAGMVWREGLWGAAITLFNVLFAAMLATNYFEPVAAMLEQHVERRLTYFWDYTALWGLFVITYIPLRIVTGLLSRYRVRFNKWIELAGCSLLALWVGWVMLCFTCMTLHTAPLPRDSFKGAFQPEPKSGNFLGMSPSRQWLAFVQSRSRGALRDLTMQEFDPNSEFIVKYGSRRQKLQEMVQKNKSFSLPQ